MAIAFRAVASGQGGASSTEAVVDKPTGTLDDDFILVGVLVVATTIDDVPAGWTLLRALSSGYRLYYKRASSEGATWTWSFSATGRMAWFAISFSGVSVSDPIDVETGVTGIYDDLSIPETMTAPTVTSEHADCVGVWMIGTNSSASSMSSISPDGMTSRIDSLKATGDQYIAVDTKDLATAGATGAQVWEMLEAPDTDGNSWCWVVVLRPSFPPATTSVSPDHGSILGGTDVVLTGTNYTGATGVTFGGVAATSVVVTDDAHISCVTPASASGAKTIAVTTPEGTG